MKNHLRMSYRRLIRGAKTREARHGIALITVLSILSVVTVLIVGFTMMACVDRTASSSYSGGMRVEQLALGALENIVLDFRKEIAAGSYDNTNNRRSEFARYYEPYRDANDIALSILPRRIGYPPTVKTAIRRSMGFKSTVEYYTNFPKLSSFSSNGASYYVTNSDVQLPEPVLYDVDSTAASKNSRSVGAERWMKPHFVNFNDSVEKSAFMSNTPSWIYIARSGVLRDIKNTNNLSDQRSDEYVIGRYAYVVYDVSGLVDITVAGHATNAALNHALTNATNDSNNISWTKKGLIQAADLTQLRIKDASGMERPIDPTSLNNLLLWRDTNMVLNSSNYTVRLFGATNFSATNTNFVSPTNNRFMKSGFTKVSENNNTFINRQDLLQYCSTNKRLKDFLPLFTTFSREKNSPSWGPRTYNSTSSSQKYGYNTNSYTKYTQAGYVSSDTETFNGYPNDIVTNVSGVRYLIPPTSFKTVTSDGRVLIYTNSESTNGRIVMTKALPPVHAGSPVLRKRFPLSRIAWLTLTNGPGGSATYGPNPDLTNAIKQTFGLVWATGTQPIWANDTNADGFGMPRWIYTSPDGSSTTATNKIKTLADLTNTTLVPIPRDPDFFETLKATILDGSLGVVEAYSIGNTYARMANFTPIMPDMYDIYKNPDLQIMRIGASIIDQADEDYFATAIDFKNSVEPSRETNETVYGVESLPYMSHLFGFNAGLNKGTLNPEHPSSGLWSSWITPGVWDPHQNASQPTNFSSDQNVNNASAFTPASNYFKPNVPMYYRVYAMGKAYTMVDWAPPNYGYNTNSDPAMSCLDTNTNATWGYLSYTNGTNVYKYTNILHPICTPVFSAAMGYRRLATNTWTPSNDMIYFDRSPTNLFYILDQAGTSTNGRMNQYGAPHSDVNGIDTNNMSVFDEPIMLIRAYVNSRPLKNNGQSTNGTNANYYTNVRHLGFTYTYSNAVSVNGVSYMGAKGNYFYGTNGDGQMHGLDASAFGGTKETNHGSWYTLDYRPGLVGFNTGITATNGSLDSRKGNTADFGRHYTLGSNATPSSILSDTNYAALPLALKNAYQYRLYTNYSLHLNPTPDPNISKYGGSPLDGKMMDVFGTTISTDSNNIANTNLYYSSVYSNLPTFVFQASTNPITGPWRTYEVVKKMNGSWGGSNNAGHSSSSVGGYYSGTNYTKNSGGWIYTYEPPDSGLEAWANTGSLVLDPRTMRLGFSHTYHILDPFSMSGDNTVLSPMVPNSTNMNASVYAGANRQPGWKHAGKYLVGKGFFSVESNNAYTTYTTWPTTLTGPLTNTNFSTFFYMINTLDVTNSGMLRFNTKISSDGVVTWYFGGMGLYGYADRDGIVRAGDAYLGLYSGKTNAILVNPMETSDNYVGRTRQIQDRPIVMNRPFRSVGELGYVHRDMPWKTLDMFTTNSADAGLLDTFSSYDYDSDYSAGKININTPYPSVLATLMSGAIQNEIPWDFTMTNSTVYKGNAAYGIMGRSRQRYNDGSALIMGNYNNNGTGRNLYNIHPTNTLTNIVISSNNALMMATNIVYNTGVTNTNANATPYLNISQFVTRYPTNTNYLTPSSVNTNISKTFDSNSMSFLPIIKTQREAYIRSLAECTQTRTWNFMIDIIAQTGHLAASANGGDSLNQFTVESERRYWLHIAIDRYTGEVVDQHLELVNE